MCFFQFCHEKGVEYTWGWLRANKADAAAMGEAKRCRRLEKQAKLRAEREERARLEKGQFSCLYLL
jgi:hypothetical protein